MTAIQNWGRCLFQRATGFSGQNDHHWLINTKAEKEDMKWWHSFSYGYAHVRMSVPYNDPHESLYPFYEISFKIWCGDCGAKYDNEDNSEYICVRCKQGRGTRASHPNIFYEKIQVPPVCEPCRNNTRESKHSMSISAGARMHRDTYNGLDVFFNPKYGDTDSSIVVTSTPRKSRDTFKSMIVKYKPKYVLVDWEGLGKDVAIIIPRNHGKSYAREYAQERTKKKRGKKD